MSSQGMDDLLKQLPPDLVAQLSQQLGVDEATAQQGLADVLPGLMGTAGQSGDSSLASGLQLGEEASHNALSGSGGADSVLGSLSADGADALQVGDAASPPAAPDPGDYGGMPGGLEQGGGDSMGGLGDILGQVLGGQGGSMPSGMDQGGDPMGGLGSILGGLLGGGQEPGYDQSGQGGGVNWGPIIAALAPLVISAIANRQRQAHFSGPMDFQAESGSEPDADDGEAAGGDQILGSLSDNR